MMRLLEPVRRRPLKLSLATLAGALVLAGAATTASAAGAVQPAVTDADVSLASLNVLTFALTNAGPDPITAPCPLMSSDELGWFMGQHGFTPNLSTFSVDVYYNDEVADGYPGIDCGSDLAGAENPDPAAPHYPIVGAAYLSEDIPFQTYLDQLDGTLLTPAVADPNIGGEVGGVCTGGRICWLNWHRGDLVVTLVVAGGNGDIDQARSETMLLAMVPTVVENLIASIDSTSVTTVPGTTGVPTVPPTVVPTAPPTVVASIPPTVAPTVPPTVPPTVVTTSPTSVPGGIPAATQQPTGLGTDPALDALAQSCFDGDMAACDQLYTDSPLDSAYETYGDTCAGRQPAVSGRYCVDAFSGASAPTTTVPVGGPTTVPVSGPTTGPAAGLDVTAAKAGLARYFAAAPIDTFVAGGACPVGDGQLLVSAMAANGLTPTTDQFDVTTIGLDPVAPTTPQLFCMMAVPLETVPRGSVFVSDITGVTTFAELVSANGGHPIANPDPATGGELGGNCYEYEGRYSCWVMWHRDGLVIDIYLTGAPGAFTEATAVAIAMPLVPQYVANLGTYQPGPV